MSKVTFEKESLEVYESSIQQLLIIIGVEAGLGCILYFVAPTIEDNGKYLLMGVLGFFFLIIASALPAVIKNAFGCNKEFRWGANTQGLLVVAQTGSIGKSNPRLLYEWSQVKSITFSYKQIIDENGMGGNLRVVFDDLKFPTNFVFQFAKSQYRVEDGYYQFFNCPKAEIIEIMQKLKKLAPDIVLIKIEK